MTTRADLEKRLAEAFAAAYWGDPSTGSADNADHFLLAARIAAEEIEKAQREAYTAGHQDAIDATQENRQQVAEGYEEIAIARREGFRQGYGKGMQDRMDAARRVRDEFREHATNWQEFYG